MTHPFAPLHVALDVDGAGAHPAASLDLDPSALVDPRRLTWAVAAAENAGATFVTFDDSLTPPAHGPAARLDAVTRAAFVAPTTSRLGLVPLAHPAVTEPFHLAAQLASLDHASAGRSGWLVGAGAVPGARAALDRPVAEGAALLAETADVVRVVRDLWDSWDDDAVVRDTATGRYVDRDRLHYVDFTSGGEGPFAGPGLRAAPDGARAPFTVKGPLIVPRGPQGQSVVVARAGAVPADLLDVALVDGADVDGALDAARRARAAGAARVVVDLAVALDTQHASGADRLAALDDRAGATLATPLVWAGSATGLADLLLGLRGAVDGVRILPAVLPDDVRELVRHVLPVLRAARAAATPRPGATLRDTLGLERPAARFASV